MRLRVSRIGAALERRNDEFFVLVDLGSADLGALRVAWARTGLKNEGIAEGMRIASASYRMLRATYGREGLRSRQGGDLTATERRQFQRLQRAQLRFAASLLLLREGARRRDDLTTAAELDRLRAEAERIAWARLRLEDYLNALIATGEMRGEWEADAPYVRSADPETFVAADEMVRDLYVDADIGHVFTVDLGTAGGWSYLEQEAPVPVGQSPGVQGFQLAEDEEEVAAEEIAASGIDEATFEGDPEPGAPSEGIEIGAEDLEETAAEPAHDEMVEILEEEDLAEDLEESDVSVLEGAEVAPPAEPAEPQGDPGAGKASSKKKDPKPARPEPAAPPAVSPAGSRSIG